MEKMHCNIMSSQQDILASSRPTGKEGPYCLRIVDLEGKEVKFSFIFERILRMQESEGSKLTLSIRCNHLMFIRLVARLKNRKMHVLLALGHAILRRQTQSTSRELWKPEKHETTKIDNLQ